MKLRNLLPKSDTQLVLEELRGIREQLTRLGDLYERALRTSPGALTLYVDPSPEGGSIHYTSDGELSEMEHIQEEYYNLTGIRLGPGELPPLEELKRAFRKKEN